MITQELFKPLYPIIQRRNIDPKELRKDIDYRHIVITRNLYDALVSGYLYHQSGHECWLSFAGAPLPKQLQKNYNWEAYMTYSDPPYHPRKRRSICQYLADESREMGMRVYMDVALSKWYSQILPYYQRVQKRNTEMKHTKFLCFEQLTQSNQTEELFLESMDWFFPGGHTYNTTPMAVQDMESTYKVAHATNSPSSVKHRLRNLVQHLDEKIFHGTYSAMDKALGCGMNGDRRSSR